MIRLTALILAAVALAGCGRDGRPHAPALDRTDPEAVSRAYFETFYTCQPGLRYDLSTSTERDLTRARYIQLEECTRAAVPHVMSARGDDGHVADVAIVTIMGRHLADTLQLFRCDDGTWKVDTLTSEIPRRS